MEQSQPADAAPDEFASLWEEYEETLEYVMPERGDLREGVIVSVRPDEVIIDIGGKQDALLSPRELQRMTPQELDELRVGQTVLVYVVRVDPQGTSAIVSLRLAREQRDWVKVQELLKSGELITVTASGYNKGGLLCEYESLQGFIPMSQIMNLAPRDSDASPADVLAEHVGREMVVKIIEVNRRRRRLILSERAAAREWREQQRETLFDELHEGQVRSGVVSNLCDFGAFVDLGGVDGLVHLSELSWGRVAHPRDILEIGQSVQVYVLSVDRERGRIGLSLKRLLPDPWETVGERYRPGQIVRGTVSHLARFGAFVELEPGIEGLIHMSELAEGDFGDPANIVTEGEELELLVLSVEPERHRIGLSLRQVPPKRVSNGDSPSTKPSSDESKSDDNAVSGMSSSLEDAF